MKHCLIKYAFFFLAVHTQTYKNDRLFILSKMHTETTVLQTLLNVLAFLSDKFSLHLEFTDYWIKVKCESQRSVANTCFTLLQIRRLKACSWLFPFAQKVKLNQSLKDDP